MRPGTSSGAVGDTVPMIATAVGLLLPGPECANKVASPVPGSATPAMGVDNPRGSPIALFPVVGEAVSMSKSMPMVGSAV